MNIQNDIENSLAPGTEMASSNTALSILQMAKARVQAKKKSLNKDEGLNQSNQKLVQDITEPDYRCHTKGEFGKRIVTNAMVTFCHNVDDSVHSAGSVKPTTSSTTEIENQSHEMKYEAKVTTADKVLPMSSEPKSRALQILQNARLKAINRDTLDSSNTIRNVISRDYPIQNDLVSIQNTEFSVQISESAIFAKTRGKYDGKFLAVASRSIQSRTKQTPDEPYDITSNPTNGGNSERAERLSSFVRLLYEYPSLFFRDTQFQYRATRDQSSYDPTEVTSIVSELAICSIQDIDKITDLCLRILLGTRDNMSTQHAFGAGGVCKMIGSILGQIVSTATRNSDDLMRQYAECLHSMLKVVCVMLRCHHEQWKVQAAHKQTFIQTKVPESLTDILQHWLAFPAILHQCLVAIELLLHDSNSVNTFLSLGVYDLAVKALQRHRELPDLCMAAYAILMHLLTSGKCAAAFVQAGILDMIISDSMECCEHAGAIVCGIIGILVDQDHSTHCLSSYECINCVKSLLHRFHSSSLLREHAFFALTRFSVSDKWKSDVSSTDFIKDSIGNVFRLNLRMENRPQKYAIAAGLALLASCAFKCDDSVYKIVADMLQQPIVDRNFQGLLCLVVHNSAHDIICAADIKRVCSASTVQVKSLDKGCVSNVSAHVVMSLCMAVTALCDVGGADFRVEFCNGGLCEILVGVIEEYCATEACICLLRTVSSLCGTWSEPTMPCVEAFVKSRLQDKVLAIWKNATEDAQKVAMVEVSCVVLGKLCFSSQGRADLGSEVCSHIIGALQNHRENVKIAAAACWALNLLLLSESTWLIIMESNAVLTVFTCLQHHVVDESVVIPGLQTLSRILTLNSLPVDFRSIDFPELLFRVYEYHSHITEACLLAQEIVCYLIAAKKMLDGILFHGLHRRLVDGFARFITSVSVVGKLLTAITQVLPNFDTLELHNISKLVVRCMQQHTNDAIASKILVDFGLNLLSFGDGEIRSTMGDADICVFLVQCLHKTVLPVDAAQCCRYLASLCRDHASNLSKCSSVDVCSVSFTVLKRSLDTQNSILASACSDLLIVLLKESGNNRERMVELGLCSVLEPSILHNWSVHDHLIKTNLMYCTLYLFCKQDLCTDGICNAVVNAMTTHRTDAVVLTSALEVVIKIAESQIGRECLMRVGIRLTIRDALTQFEGNEPIVSKVSRALMVLSSSSDSVSKFEDDQIYDQCATLLRKHMSSALICQNILDTMSSSISSSEEVTQTLLRRKRWADRNMGSMLCDIGHRHINSSDVFSSMCDAIFELADGFPENAIMLAACGACEMTCQGMGIHREDPIVMEKASRALASLAFGHIGNKSRIERCGGCDHILAVLTMHVDHANAVKEACTAVIALCEDCPTNCLVLTGRDAFVILADIADVHIMNSIITETISNARRALAATDVLSDDVCTVALDNLCRCVSAEDDAAILTALSAISSLSEGHIINQLDFGRMGACELLTGILSKRQHGFLGDSAILRAINSLCRHGNGNSLYVSENVWRFVSAGAADLVLAKMKFGNNSPDTCLYGSSILLYFLASHSSILDSLDIPSLCKVVHSALLHQLRNATVVEMVSSLIELMSSFSSHFEIALIIETITVLVDAFRLHSGKTISEKAAFAACRALSTLLEFGGELAGHAVEATEFSILLVNVLDEKKSNPHFAGLGCLTVTRLISVCDQSSLNSRFRQLGLCEILHAILQSHGAKPEICYNACEVLCALCDNCIENQTRLGKGGIGTALLDSLQKLSDDRIFCRIACRAVCALTSNHTDNKVLLGRSGACDILLHTLQVYFADEELIVQCLMAIRNLSGCLDISTIWMECDAFSIVSNVFLNHINVAEIVEHCCAILSNLMIGTDAFKADLEKTKIYDACIASLFHDSADHHSHSMTCILIANICSGHEANSKKMINKGLGEGLMHLLHVAADTEAIFGMASVVISSLSGFTDCMDRLSTLGVCQSILKFNGRSQLIIAQWCSAVATMATCENCIPLFVELEIITRVLDIMESNSEDAALTQATCEVLKHLSNNDNMWNTRLSARAIRLTLRSCGKYHINESNLEIALEIVWNRCLHESENRSTALEEDIVHVMQNALANFTDNEVINSCCLHLTHLLYKDHEHMKSSEASPALCNAMYRFSTGLEKQPKDFVILVYQSIYSLLAANSSNVEEFLTLGLADHVSRRFDNILFENHEITALVCKIVGLLCATSKRCADKFAKTKIPNVVVQILESNSAIPSSDSVVISLCESACNAMAGLSVVSEGERVLSQYGSRALVLSALKNFLDNPTICASASEAMISSIKSNAQSTVDYCISGAIDLELSVIQLYKENFCVITSAVRCITQIFAGLHRADAKYAITNHQQLAHVICEIMELHRKSQMYSCFCDFIVAGTSIHVFSPLDTVLIDTLVKYSSSFLERATVVSLMCRVVLHLCTESTEYCPVLNSVKTTPLLLSAAKYNLSSPTTIGIICKTLTALAIASEVNVENFSEYGGCDVMLAILRNSELHSVLNDVGSVLQAYCETNTNAVSFLAHGGYEVLIDTLQAHKDSRDAVLGVCHAIHAMEMSIKQYCSVDTEIVQGLVQELKPKYTGDGEVLASMMCLYSLVSTEGIDERHDVSIQTAKALLQSLLANIEDSNLIMQAVRGIIGLVDEDGTCAEYLVDNGICEVLVKYITDHEDCSHQLLEVMYMAIHHLNSKHPGLFAKLRKLGLLTICSRSLAKHCNHGNVCFAICCVIDDVEAGGTDENDVIPHSYSRQDIEVLYQSLHTLVTWKPERCGKVLSILCTAITLGHSITVEVVKELFDSSNCIDIVMALLMHNSVSVDTHISAVNLLLLLGKDSCVVNAAHMPKLSPLIVSCLNSHQHNLSFCRCGLSLLTNCLTKGSISETINHLDDNVCYLCFRLIHRFGDDLVVAEMSSCIVLLMVTHRSYKVQDDAIIVVLEQMKTFGTRSDVLVRNCLGLILAFFQRRSGIFLRKTELGAQLKAVVASFGSEGSIMEIVVDLMRACLDFDNEYASVWTSLGVNDSLMNELKSRDKHEGLCLSICRYVSAFSKLSTDDALSLGVLGTCEIIASILERSKEQSKEIINLTLESIRDLCRDNPKNALRFGYAGSCEIISNLISLQNFSPDTNEFLCLLVETVWFLCENCVPNKEKFLKSPLPVALLNLMAIWDKDERIARMCCGAIWHMVINSSNGCDIFANLKAVDRIEHVMKIHHKSEEVSRLGCGALWALSVHEPGDEVKSSSNSSLRTLLDTMTEHMNDPKIVSVGCVTLCNICIDESSASILGSGGVVEVILAALKQHTSNTDVTLAGCRAIAKLCVNGANANRFFELGTLQLIYNIGMQNVDQKELCQAVFKSISTLISDAEERAVELMEMDINSLIISSLQRHPKCITIHESVLELTMSLIELLPSSSLLFGNCGMCEIIVAGLNLYATQSIDTNALVADYAIHIIFQLCGESRNAMRLVMAGLFEALEIALRVFFQRASFATFVAKIIQSLTDASELQREQYQCSLAECGFCEDLIQLLDHHMDDTKCTLEVIRGTVGICLGNMLNIVRVQKCDGINAIHSVLEKYSSSNLDISRTICGLIVVLNAHEEMAEELGRMGSCEYVVNAFSMAVTNRDIDALETICYAMVSLIRGNSGNQIAMGRSKDTTLLMSSVLSGWARVSVSAEESALWLISILCKHSKDKDSICQENILRLSIPGGFSSVTETITKHISHIDCAVAGGHAICNLSYSENSESIQLLGSCGGCKAIVSILREHMSRVDCVEPAIGGLANLARRTENVSLLKALGVSEIVATICRLYPFHCDIIIPLCGAVKYLALDDDINDKFSVSNIYQSIVGILINEPDMNGADLLLCLEALQNLFRIRDGCISTLSDGVSTVIVELILSKWISVQDSAIVLTSCSVLEQILLSESDMSVTSVSLKLCGQLLAILRIYRDSAPIVSVACNIVRLLCLRSDDCAREFAGLEVHEEIVNVMQSFQDDITTTQIAALTLQTILTDSGTRCNMGLRSTCDAVLKSLRRHTENAGMIEQNCASMLQIVNKGAQNVEVIVEMGGCEILVSILRKHGHVQSTLKSVLSILEYISQSSSAVIFMSSIGMCEAFVGAFRRHLGTDLILTESFLHSLEFFSAVPECASTLGMTGCCELLATILSDAIERNHSSLIVSAARNIQFLCTDCPMNAESFGICGTCVTIAIAINSKIDMESLVALLLAARRLCQQDLEGLMANAFNVDAFKNSLLNEQFVELISSYLSFDDCVNALLLLIHCMLNDSESLEKCFSMGLCKVISPLFQSQEKWPSDSLIPIVCDFARDGACLSFLIDNGVVPYVVSLYARLDTLSTYMIQQCFDAVTLIARHHLDLLEHFIKSGLCSRILNAARSCSSMSNSFVVALSSVTAALGSNKYALTDLQKCGAGDMFFDIWRVHDSDASTVDAIAVAVMALSNNQAISCQFMAKGGADVLVKLFRRFMTSVGVISKLVTIVMQILGERDNSGTSILFFQAGLCEILLTAFRRYSENPDILSKCCCVFSILAVSEDISALLANGGACEGSVNAIKVFDNDVRVVHNGCKAIRNLAMLSTNRTLLLVQDATQCIVSVLRRFVHTEKVVMEACGALVNLHSDSSPDSLRNVNRILGAAGDLVKVLIVQVDSAGTMDQLFALIKILANEDSSREVLGVHDICKSIPQAILKHIDNISVVEKGIGAVSRVSYRNIQNKLLFSETSICEIIVTVMRKHSENEKLLEACCVAATSLTTACTKNIEQFVEHGMCNLMEIILTSNSGSDSLCAAACQTITRLSQVDAAQERFHESKVAILVCNSLQKHISSSLFTRHACDALRSVGTTPDVIASIVEAGATNSLVKIVVNFVSNRECIIAAMSVMSALAPLSNAFSTVIGEVGMCEALVLALAENKSDAVTAYAAVNALLALSSTESNSIRFATASSYDLIADCMRNYHNDYKFTLRCCECIASITKSGHARSIAATAGICESISQAFEIYDGDKEFVSAAAVATAKVAEGSSTNADRCAKTKLCLMIFRAIETHMHSSDTVAALLLAVGSLAITVLNRRFFGGGDGCELVKISLLKNISNHTVCINAANAICAISTDSFENKDMYGKIGVIDILAKIIRNNKEFGATVIMACNAINILCTDHIENVERASRESIAELLVGAIRSHSSDFGVIESVCKLLINILSSKPQYVETMKGLNVREILVQLIDVQRNHASSLAYTVRLLRDIYASEEDSSILDPISNECLFLTTALSSHILDMAISEDICGIIFLISRKRLSRSVSVLGDCGACELIANSVSVAVKYNNMSLAKMSLLALVSLCAGSSSNQTKFGESGACAGVVSVMKEMGGASSALCIDMEGAALNAVAMLVRHGKLKTSENEANTQILLEHGACEIVIKCLDNRLDNMPIVYSACRAIFCLASNDACSARLLDCGAGDLVVRVLRSYQTFPSIIQYTIGAVANLGFTIDGARNLHTNGVCDALVKAIGANKKDAHTAQHGCNAIKNLSVDDADIRAALGAAGACKLLLSVLKAHVDNINVLCPAMLAVSNMIVDIPVHAETFMHAQIDQKLKRIVEDNLSVELVCSCAFAVIGNLCDHEFSKKSLIDTGFCDIVTAVVKKHISSENIVVRCFVSLIRLNGDDQLRCLQHNEKELCELVVEALKCHSSNEIVVDVACKVLVCLGEHSDYNRTKLIEAGAAEQAILILSKKSTDSVSVAQVCRVIIFLACDSRSRNLLKSLGMCKRVVSMLSIYKSQAEMSGLLAKALRALSVDCVENATELVRAGVIEQLTKALDQNSFSSSTGMYICDGLTDILKNSEEQMTAEDVIGMYTLVSTYFHRFWSESRVTKSVCGLILVLSKKSDAKPIPPDIVESLVLASSEHIAVPEVLSLCMHAAIALVVSDKEIVGLLGTSSMCKSVVTLLSSFTSNLDILCVGLKMVAYLCMDQANRVRLGDGGVCDAIEMVLKKHVSVDSILESGLAAIKILATNTPSNKEQLGQCGICEIIVEVLKFGYCSAKQVELALASIANIANDTNGNNVLRLDNAGIITALTDIFQNHIGSPSIMKQACLIVKHLASHPRGPQKKLGELEICDKVNLALAMHLGVDQTNIAICSSVRALAQDTRNKLILGECGACNIIAKVLDLAVENGDIKLLEESLLTVVALVSGSSKNQQAAGRAGICQLVCQSLSTDYGYSIDEKAMWSVVYLCRSGAECSTTSEENVATLVECKVLDAIDEFLNMYIANIDVLLPTCWAIRNICFIHSNAVRVINSDGILKICSALQRHVQTSGLCEAACYALSSVLAVDHHGSLESTGICEIIVNVLRRHMNSQEIVGRCCSVIANLSSSGPWYRHRLGNEGVCVILVRSLKIHMRVGGVVEEACGAIWNMSMESDDNRSRFGQEGACEAVIDAVKIHSNNVYVHDAGLGCLHALIAENDYNLKRVQACGVDILGGKGAIFTNKSNTVDASLRE